MLVNTNDGFLRQSENFEKSNFTIKASSKAFSILSSALYQNKIRAIIRELSCNAIDSQRARGTDKRFSLHLPNLDNPEFKIRDFGTGISPEDIIQVYTTYFESTKTHSNDMIGCLGLGSKTPFCYTDNFMINSYFEGFKRSYAAAINEEGMPVCALVAEELTSEDSGLEISFSVKTQDFATFAKETRFVCHFLELQPIVSGYSTAIKKIEAREVVRGKYWKIVSPDAYVDQDASALRPAFVVMGNVPYQISADNIPNLSTEESAVLKCSIQIEAPIGAVEPQASRESLSYTKPTISYLKNALAEIVLELKRERQEEIATCKTFFDAILLHEKNRHKNTEEPFRTLFSSFSFNGKQIVFPIKLTAPTSRYVTGLEKYQRYGRGANPDSIAVKRIEDSRVYEGVLENVIFLKRESADAHAKGFDAALSVARKWLSENDGKGRGTKIFFIEKSVADHLELIDGETIFDYNTLPALNKPTKPRAAANYNRIGKKKTQAWVMGGWPLIADSRTVAVDLEDLKDEHVYVTVVHKKIQPIPSIGAWDVLATQCARMFDLDVIGLTPSQTFEVQNRPNWKEIRTAAAERLTNVVSNKDKIVEHYETKNKMSALGLKVFAKTSLAELVKKLALKNSTNEIVQMYEDIFNKKASNSNSTPMDVEKIHNTMHNMGFNQSYNTMRLITIFGNNHQAWADATKSLDDFQKEGEANADSIKKSILAREKDLISKYPILKLFFNDDIDDDALSVISEKCF